jgi:hypothetical protein
MTPDELAAKAAADSAARTKQADDDALLAAEAFAFGVFDKYHAAKIHDINRRINERFGTTGSEPVNAGEPTS